MVAKKYRRTTIELDVTLYKRVKALAVEKDMTLREIISEALEEKLAQEEEKNDAMNSDFLRENPLSKKIVRAMETFISRDAAILLFIKKCESRNYDPYTITREMVTEDFLSSLCNGIRHLSDVDNTECLKVLKTAVGGF